MASKKLFRIYRGIMIKLGPNYQTREEQRLRQVSRFHVGVVLNSVIEERAKNMMQGFLYTRNKRVF